MDRYQRGANKAALRTGRKRQESVEESLGKAVRNRRSEVGMTQVRLAELAGMTQAAISRLEHGKCMPTIPLLERIAAAFDSALFVVIEPGRGVAVGFRGSREPNARAATEAGAR
ncbi:helix-turn-helix domain-containing protein [Streptomyces sp. CAI-85]|uniref:helix-turn-helix domain-containing protein n=1 Tax=Streptomyces sp. CAI-85 TaxID=1472662 RepID=UPI001587E6CE|nr:helix-turn-helix transcriptional regulator [Streptomyces sp. CAI-85]NUV59133.1 helix-turn-helix transcriptional regulator [Streptomyces sp. CAI-85]